MTVTLSKNYRSSDPYEFFQRLLTAAFPGVIPEYRFHHKRKWKIDYWLPIQKVGIEIEGGIWTGGRHIRPSGFIKDIEKYNTAALMGIKIYRVAYPDLKSVRKILEHIQRIKNYHRLSEET